MAVTPSPRFLTATPAKCLRLDMFVPELLLSVFQYVDSFQTLHSLLLTSRVFYAVFRSNQRSIVPRIARNEIGHDVWTHALELLQFQRDIEPYRELWTLFATPEEARAKAQEENYRILPSTSTTSTATGMISRNDVWQLLDNKKRITKSLENFLCITDDWESTEDNQNFAIRPHVFSISERTRFERSLYQCWLFGLRVIYDPPTASHEHLASSPKHCLDSIPIRELLDMHEVATVFSRAWVYWDEYNKRDVQADMGWLQGEREGVCDFLRPYHSYILERLTWRLNQISHRSRNETFSFLCTAFGGGDSVFDCMQGYVEENLKKALEGRMQEVAPGRSLAWAL